MAISFTDLDTPDFNNGSNLTSYDSASWTPPSSGIVVLFVHARVSGGPTTPTVSGNNLTWTQIGSTYEGQSGNGDGLSCFAADLSGSPTTGVTNIDFGAATQVHCVAHFFQVTGVDISGGLSSGFVQNQQTRGTSATSGGVTLNSPGSSDNRPAAFLYHQVDETMTEGTDFTLLDKDNGAGQTRSLLTEYRGDAFDTFPDASWTTSGDWAAFGIELKAASSTPTLSIANLSVSTTVEKVIFPVGLIAYIDFEEGDNSDWSSETGGEDLAYNGTAAMVGSYGMQLTHNDTSPHYGQKNITHQTNILRFGWWWDPNGYTVGTTTIDSFVIGTSGSPSQLFKIRIIASSSYTLQISAIGDDGLGEPGFSTVAASDSPHYFEVRLTRESYDGAADGECTVWMDDVQKGSISNWENFNTWPLVNKIMAGSVFSNASSGSEFFDEIIVRDDDVSIWGTDLAVDNLSQSTTVAKLALTQTYVLGTKNLSQANSVDKVAITTTYNLAVASLSQSTTVDKIAVSTTYSMAVDDLYQATQVPFMTLGATGVIDGRNLFAYSTVEKVSITQAHNITVSDLSQATVVDHITLSAQLELSTRNLSQANTVEFLTLVQNHNMSVDNLSQLNSIGHLTIVQEHNVDVYDLSQSSTVTKPYVNTSTQMYINNLSGASTVEHFNLVQDHNITVSDLYQTNNITHIFLGQWWIEYQEEVALVSITVSMVGYIDMEQEEYTVIDMSLEEDSYMTQSLEEDGEIGATQDYPAEIALTVERNAQI